VDGEFAAAEVVRRREIMVREAVPGKETLRVSITKSFCGRVAWME
jgi:hypothetical protein